MLIDVIYTDNQKCRCSTFLEFNDDTKEITVPISIFHNARRDSVVEFKLISPEEEKRLNSFTDELIRNQIQPNESDAADIRAFIETDATYNEIATVDRSKKWLFGSIHDFFRRKVSGNPRKWIEADDCRLVLKEGAAFEIEHEKEGIVFKASDARFSLAVLLGLKIRKSE